MARSDLDGSLSTLGALTLMCGLTAALFLLLYWLMQPKVLDNPGMASYRPPPATRLEPLPRESNAPELAYVPENFNSALAEAPEPPTPPKQEVRERAKKPSPRPRRSPERNQSYAQQQQQQQPSAPGYGQQRAGFWSWF
jgi:hypothetical protein